MKSNLNLETKSGNKYLADINEKFFSISHPLLSYFFSLEENNETIEINKILLQKIVIEGIKYSKEEINYYYKKYLFLKQNDINTENNVTNIHFTKITPQLLKHQLANISQLVFEVTDKCNLKCRYCGYGEFYEGYDERTNKFLDFKEMIPFINYIERHWNSTQNTSCAELIHIGFYGGEPLLNTRFIYEAVNYFNTKSTNSKKFVFNMTTNGVLLNKHMDFLNKNNFNLLISLDGNKHNHSYRPFHGGQESFDIVFENIKKLKAKYPKYFDDYVDFNAVLHNRNSIKEIHEFIKGEFSKIPEISELSKTEVKISKKKNFDQMYRTAYSSFKEAENSNLIKNDMFKVLGETQDSYKFLYKHSGNIFKSAENLIYKRGNKIRILPTGTCLPFSRKLFITASGKILPCETIGHQFSLGNATPKDVNINLESIAEKYNNYYKSLEKQCNSCLKKESCPQCLFKIKNIHSNPVCDKFESSNKISNHLSLHLSQLEEQPHLYQRIMKDILTN